MTQGPGVGSTAAHIVAVIQARMRSTRLPGKVLEPIEGRPLLAWTVAGVQAIRGVADVVVATTGDATDDAIASLAAELDVRVHRGSTHDVLRRCVDAVRSSGPDIVIRQTADNPFPDPAVAEAQVRTLIDGDLDYVGIDGWPLGIAAEACRFSALAIADREATETADREHVTAFLYRHPDRFRIGRVPRARVGRQEEGRARYTVDTAADLAFARALATELGGVPPVSLARLEAIIEDHPELLEINAGVGQKSWRTSQLDEEDPWTS